MFDRMLECDLSRAFKECGMNIETYNGFAIPEGVAKKMEEIADERDQAMWDAGLIPGSRFW